RPVYACERLANGNIFVAAEEAWELTSEGKELDRKRLMHGGVEVRCNQPLGDGRILGTRYGEKNTFLLAEIEPLTAQDERAFRIGTVWEKPRWVEPLLGGGYLIPAGDGKSLCEVDSAGKNRWSCPLEGVGRALRLRTGNTIVATGDQFGPCIVEADQQGKVVWEAVTEGSAIRLRNCLRLVRVGLSWPRSAGLDLREAVGCRMEEVKKVQPWGRWRRLGGLGSLAEQGAPAGAPAI